MSSARRLWPASLAAAAKLAAGCARVGMPGGGPADTTPPLVVSSAPQQAAKGVALDTMIRLEFSESMNRVNVERGFSIAPPTALKNFAWEGDALVVRPQAALPESTTFVVRLAETADDYHGVKMDSAFVLTFSTGPTVDTGVVGGEVAIAGEPVPGATVWVCRRSLRAQSGEIERCRYEATTGPDGAFIVNGVAARELPYTVVAFLDVDEDGVYSVREEAGAIAAVEARITEPGAEATGIKIEIVDPLDEGAPTGSGEEELWNSQR